MMQCERCDTGVALLIFAVRATDHGGLEDYARKMYREAIETFRTGSPKDPVLLNKIGIAYHQLMQLDNARKSYEAAIKIRPDYMEALNNLGSVLRSQRRFREALLQYDKALAEKPDLAETLSNRGVTLSELGRFPEALVSLDRSLKLNPELAEAWKTAWDTGPRWREKLEAGRARLEKGPQDALEAVLRKASESKKRRGLTH